MVFLAIRARCVEVSFVAASLLAERLASVKYEIQAMFVPWHTEVIYPR